MTFVFFIPGISIGKFLLSNICARSHRFTVIYYYNADKQNLVQEKKES